MGIACSIISGKRIGCRGYRFLKRDFKKVVFSVHTWGCPNSSIWSWWAQLHLGHEPHPHFWPLSGPLGHWPWYGRVWKHSHCNSCHSSSRLWVAAAQLVLTDLDWSELHFYLLSLLTHYHSTDVAVVLRSHCNNLGYHLCLVDPDRRLEVLCELWKSLEDGLDRNSCDRCLRILVHYLNVKKYTRY